MLDSIQMDDAAFRMAAELGTLYSCVMPGRANIIGGLSAIVRHDAPHTTAALIGRAGLNKQGAVEYITRKPAEFLGIGDRLGTLAKGEWASFVCWSGDPFDIASYTVAVYMEGCKLQ